MIQSLSPTLKDLHNNIRTISHLGSKEVKFLMIFTYLQLEKLEEVFNESKYPDVYRREEIAAQLDLKEEVVRVGLIRNSFYVFR